MWATMELIMSTIYTPATSRVRSRGSDLIATVETWWMRYLTRRIERAAIIQLHAVSGRELQDIDPTLSQIERAVRRELDHQPFARQPEPFVRRRSHLQHGAHCEKKDGARMSGLRRNWLLAMATALISMLMVGAADARGGGGHGGAIAPPMTSTSHMGAMTSPTIGLSGVHSAMPGGMLRQPGGAMRAPFAATITPPAIISRPRTMQGPVGATAGNGSASAAAAAALTNFGFGVGTIRIPPAPAPTPPPEIAAPAPELAPIAPLSPQLDTQFSTGGVVQQPNMALSPGASPSMPGGGGDTLADCMAMWDAGTHMSTVEWREACARTLNGLDVPADSPATASANRKRERLTHYSGKAGSSKSIMSPPRHQRRANLSYDHRLS
jgi:hypothetical protein